MRKFAKSPLALIIASALAGTIVAAPAMAKPAKETRLDVQVKERNGTTVYCVNYAVPDSLIPRNVCRTRAQWVEAGATFRTTAKLAMNDTAKDAHN